ncbi:MAG: triose-phosphate isomerase [Gemmatimonadota bacterium]
MRKPVFAANWKMNVGPTEARAFLKKFLAKYKKRADRTVVLIPPAISLTTVVAGLARRKDILVGMQNIHTEAKGAFTGETSAAMARAAGARVVLVGHSERRYVFGEPDSATAIKCSIAVENGLTPILCVGEKLEQREAGTTEETVLRQLRAGLSGIEPALIPKVLLAYEPVWAIGTGRTAMPADASHVHRVLRAELGALCRSQKTAAAIPILYGGSVTDVNAAALLGAGDVDGLLVGGASLDPVKWSAIVST